MGASIFWACFQTRNLWPDLTLIPDFQPRDRFVSPRLHVTQKWMQHGEAGRCITCQNKLIAGGWMPSTHYFWNPMKFINEYANKKKCKPRFRKRKKHRQTNAYMWQKKGMPECSWQLLLEPHLLSCLKMWPSCNDRQGLYETMTSSWLCVARL